MKIAATTEGARISYDLHDVSDVKSFVRHFPDLGKTDKALYWDIYNSRYNGLDDYGAVLRKGRRVWIVVPRYRDWLFGQGG